tara:strand:+ start:903 stop:1328 length:426 start_codon:yes stop_codon:yes gene_type:complete
MKVTLRKYLFFISAMLLCSLANLQASVAYNSDETSSYEITDEDFSEALITTFLSDSATFTPIHKDTKNDLFFECNEINESENEESTVKHKANFQLSLFAATLNADLYRSFSNELQRNIYRPQPAVTQQNTRLHLKLQVFII